jgi:glycosyltransferase involved in cell wall biosynthesis
MRIDLFWMSASESRAPNWTLGETIRVAKTLDALAAARPLHGAQFVLFWDEAFGKPDEAAVAAAACSPGDVWHAGLRLGMVGLPRAIDFVDPVWRFNRDPDAKVVATSWRMSLRACLVRATVLERLGGPNPHFETFEGAALELGHRWIKRGAMMRHVPRLLPDGIDTIHPPTIPLDDELRFLRLAYGKMWTYWAAYRLLRKGIGVSQLARALRRSDISAVTTASDFHETYMQSAGSARYNGNVRNHNAGSRPVSILIPTLERYPYLFALLAQLRHQTITPLEIIVIDQSGRDHNKNGWPERFSDLPLRVIYRDRPGQSSARNAGLQAVRGDVVLFLDDDDVVPPDLTARHLAFMERSAVDVSCGVALEPGARPSPAEFGYTRDSDVFPTNNSMVRTAALHESGLFDLAYERGERADHDLGMRLYLAGAILGLNPHASVTHLHAPRGGLREHSVRVVTRSASRASLRTRHILSDTEAYLWVRYFSERQVEEALLIRTFSTLRGDRPGVVRGVRALIMLLLLRDTRRRNRSALARGRTMLDDYPQIPAFERGAPLETVST